MKELIYSILLQAVKDFVRADEAGRKKIIKELRGYWCDFISNGLSLAMADKMEKNPKEIIDRWNNEKEELKDVI